MIDAMNGIGPATSGSVGAVGWSGGLATRRATSASAPGRDFASMIGEAVQGLNEKLRQAEAVSMSAMKGTATTQDVVEHVTAAEQSLQAAVAVRDKVVAAYLEISRMSI